MVVPVASGELTITNVAKSYGALEVLTDVNFSIPTGQRWALIGPNGAGKTTLFNMISGGVRPSRGSIKLGDDELVGRRPDQIARLGVGRTFQTTNLFVELSILDNVRLASARRLNGHRRMLRWKSAVQKATDLALSQLTELAMDADPHRIVRDLSYGEQRQVELAVAMCLRPRALLLDEPTAGMSPAETVEMANAISRLPSDVTVLIVEHDMDVVFSVAEHVCVLNQGRLVFEGTGADVRTSQIVREAYLGTSQDQSPTTKNYRSDQPTPERGQS